jgi:hypothetical protein
MTNRTAVVRVAAALLLWLGAAGLAAACDSHEPGCVCPKPEADDGITQPLTWVEQSVVGAGAAGGSHAAASASRNWKLFPDKIQDVVHDVQAHRRGRADLYRYLGLVSISTVLFAVIAVLIYKNHVGRELRRLFQILFLVLWVFVFAQCLCSVKDVAVLAAYAGGGRWFYGLCTAWLALLTIAFTLVIRRRFRSFYCFWACPVGAVQDLVETGLHRKMSGRLKVALLAAIGLALAAILAWKVPRPLNLLGSGALALLMIAFAIVAILRPAADRALRKFVYLSMVGWFALNLLVMLHDIENKTPGPWCVPGVANFQYPLVLVFLALVAVSMIAPRAWCNYVCPNRGLFELLCGKSGDKQEPASAAERAAQPSDRGNSP